MCSKWLCGLTLAIAIAGSASRAHGVILYAKADRNTRPPHASLVNSGWQWQGHFGSFLGTPIASNYFITSGHVGGKPGQSFVFEGQAYTTTAFYDDPSSDLRIWKVDGDGFKNWAPVFKDETEVGRSCVLFGRGTQRGEEIWQNGELKGWQWGPGDGLQSWGRNSIVGVVDGGPQRGDLLTLNFDRFGNSHEGTLSAGDSGGGVFVKHGSRWKLVGINTSVDGPYAHVAGEEPFNGSLFDKGGMYVPRLNGGTTVADSTTDIPSIAYVTRISTNMDWINNVLMGKVEPGGSLTDHTSGGIPEPTGALITLTMLGGMTLLRMRFTRRH
jgi:hypothetical protein